MSAPPTDVAARLERLAAYAPPPGIDADAVWSRGRRRQARTWLVMGACAVVLAGFGSWAVPPVLRIAAEPVAVTALDAGLVLPDVLRQPDPWEPSFPAAPGPLSAIGYGYSSGWFSDGTPFWGVSATTGESRFLDLPGASTDIERMPVLSEDGTRLAYWLTGEVPDPVPTLGDGGVDERPVVGVAVLDLRTGVTARWARDTPRGMGTDGLAWSGSVLWWTGGDWDASSTAGGGSYEVVTRTWDIATDERAEVGSGPGAALSGLDAARPLQGGFVVTEGRRLLQVTGTEVRVAGRVATPLRDQAWSSASMSPDGALLAGIEEPDPSSVTSDAQRLLVGRVSAPSTDDGRIDVQPIGDVEAQAVLGWRSPSEVVVLTTDDVRTRTAEVVDVTTGEVRPLVDLSDPMNLPHVTADAWAGEIVPAPDAPFAPDPKKLGGWLLLATLAALLLAHAARGRRGHA